MLCVIPKHRTPTDRTDVSEDARDSHPTANAFTDTEADIDAIDFAAVPAIPTTKAEAERLAEAWTASGGRMPWPDGIATPDWWVPLSVWQPDEAFEPKEAGCNQKTQREWRRRLVRQAKHCRYCARRVSETHSEHAPESTLDHLIPKSRGGLEHPLNYQLCCTRCNTAKGDLTPDEWLELIRTGTLPAAVAQARIVREFGDKYRCQIGGVA